MLFRGNLIKIFGFLYLYIKLGKLIRLFRIDFVVLLSLVLKLVYY